LGRCNSDGTRLSFTEKQLPEELQILCVSSCDATTPNTPLSALLSPSRICSLSDRKVPVSHVMKILLKLVGGSGVILPKLKQFT